MPTSYVFHKLLLHVLVGSCVHVHESSYFHSIPTSYVFVLELRVFCAPALHAASLSHARARALHGRGSCCHRPSSLAWSRASWPRSPWAVCLLGYNYNGSAFRAGHSCALVMEERHVLLFTRDSFAQSAFRPIIYTTTTRLEPPSGQPLKEIQRPLGFG